MKFIKKIKELREPNKKDENDDSLTGIQLDLEDIGNATFDEEDEEKSEQGNETKEPNWEFEKKPITNL